MEASALGVAPASWLSSACDPVLHEGQDPGGIIIPDKVRDRESFATVAAYVVKVGPGLTKIPKIPNRTVV